MLTVSYITKCVIRLTVAHTKVDRVLREIMYISIALFLAATRYIIQYDTAPGDPSTTVVE